MMRRKQIILLVGTILFCQICSYSQETIIRPYLGFSTGHTLFAGSFNGSSFFETDEDIMLVPKIHPAFGIGGVMGLRLNNGAGEIGYYYYKSEYTTEEGDYSGECVTHLIRALGITKYLNAYADRTVSPYIDVDMSVSYSVFNKIAYPYGRLEEPSQGTYGAIIFGVGAGVLIKISKKLVFDFKVLPEYYAGTDIRVKGRDRYAITKFGNLLLHNTIGIKYYFKAI